MRTDQAASTGIDEYIAAFPVDVQRRLSKLRLAIRRAAPDAQETIKYRMPTFTLNGNLVHFAAFKNHIGFYPAPRGIQQFRKELSRYEGGKGTVRFPLNEPLPLALIGRIVKFRAGENRERARRKKR